VREVTFVHDDNLTRSLCGPVGTLTSEGAIWIGTGTARFRVGRPRQAAAIVNMHEGKSRAHRPSKAWPCGIPGQKRYFTANWITRASVMVLTI
jgi:hypothetical protein